MKRSKMRSSRVLAMAAGLIAMGAGCSDAPPSSSSEPLAHVEEPEKPQPIRVMRGVASFYGKGFHGQSTASGETFDMHDMTAAHRRLPFGSKVRVINLRNEEAVTVEINDRGPFGGNQRVIDLSRAAARKLGMLDKGTAPVKLEVMALGDGTP